VALVGIENAGAGVGIAILDSGIDASHPGFEDEDLVPPQGFPRANSRSNSAYVSTKVIVARSYEALAGEPGYGDDASDVNGHGTNAACSAACVVHDTPLGLLSGSAPKAFLGNYKVLGDDGSGSESAILKGIDDAVKDGFDVLNLSLGSELTDDPANDLQVRAVNAASDAGAIVLAAAGNEGSDNNDNSINSPGLADKIITVGSASSDRSLDLDGNTERIDPNRISDFSSRGPSLAGTIKPDMLAVGDNLYVAASTLAEEGSFYTVTQGTSFATPIVAGAAAFLVAARPDLTAEQYRSLLVNSSTVLRSSVTGAPLPVRHQGAGRLDMFAALEQPVAAAPVSLNFGRGSSNVAISRELAITNVSEQGVTLRFSVESFDGRLVPTLNNIPTVLGPNETATLQVRFNGGGLSGEYQGVIVVANDRNSVVARIPYWYAVPTPVPASITLFKVPAMGDA
jgi:subtilisin family serine protease